MVPPTTQFGERWDGGNVGDVKWQDRVVFPREITLKELRDEGGDFADLTADTVNREVIIQVAKRQYQWVLEESKYPTKTRTRNGYLLVAFVR